MGRRALFGVAGAIVILLAGTGGCGWSVVTTGRAILEGRKDIFDQAYPAAAWCGNGLPLLDRLKELLDHKTYIILLQNNTELRPTGGFMGSYVRVETEGGVIKSWMVQDIYEPDGKLPGHVEPPYPIQESFRQGWWKLRDANWDPDFASAAAIVAWFFEQGGEKVDGVAAVNLGFIKKWLEIMGPVKVVSFNQELTDENFYSLAQARAEVRIEKNVTLKRDFLGAAGVALVEKTKVAGVMKLMNLMKAFKEELDNKQMFIWSKDNGVNDVIKQRGWGGNLGFSGGETADYLYIVEANLGANKANCCVERSVQQKISGRENKIEISWINSSKYENPVAAEGFWGGNYINYARVIVPAEAEITGVAVGGRELRRAGAEDFGFPNSLRQERTTEMYAVEKRGGLQIIGFWADVPAGGETRAEIHLHNKEKARPYPILVGRQPGIEGFDYRLEVDGKEIWEGVITEEKKFIIP